MMPFSVETLVPSGPRNRGQSRPWAWARQGDKETRRQGDRKTMRNGALVLTRRISISLSPCLLVSLSPDVSMAAFILFRLDLSDLLHPPRVAAALERGVEPDADHLVHQVFAEEV